MVDHSLIPPCQVTCPLKMEVREYIDQVAQGRIMEAVQVIRNGNPFPSICAFVCTHPCEDACRRSQVDKPVAIRALKRFAVEFGGEKMLRAEAETTHSERIAIIGSGPAGMSCAYYLRKLGYPVTIFEAHTSLGGMLRVGIPQYRLPREVLDIEVERLIQMGVEIRTNTKVISLDLPFEMGYKAVFITIGAHQSLRLDIEGEESPGVIDGATFLREVNLGLRPSLGERVAIVGGGNVAFDAARTATRLGTKKVNVLYRRSRDEMPASSEEIEQAIEEGIEISFLVTPVSIKREDDQLIIRCIHMELGEPDASGRRRPIPVENSEFDMKFDTLIVAIGQAPQMPGDFHIRIGKGSTIQVDPITLTTNKLGVFAGGDVVTGPGTVTEALAAGRLAAQRIDDYLQHRYPVTVREGRSNLTSDLSTKTIDIIKRISRLVPPIQAPNERAKDFGPVELVYSWDDAVSEARRCLRCGLGAEILSQEKCATCLNCLRICPYQVPYLDTSGTIQIPVDQCQACGICVAECPAKVIVLRKPYDRRHITEELEHVLETAEPQLQPLIISFCCQYGLYGTGTLARLWRRARAGIKIVPVLCVAKIEASQMLRPFERGAEGVFIAGCGEQCARENTAPWLLSRVYKVREVLQQIGFEPERLQTFMWSEGSDDPSLKMDEFIEQISQLYLNSIIKQEVKG